MVPLVECQNDFRIPNFLEHSLIINFVLQTVVSMASLMDGGNVSSIAELMKHYSLKESLTEASENHKTLTNNGLNAQKSGPHVTLVTKILFLDSA